MKSRITDATLAALKERLHGPLISRDASAYDEARALWNGRIDARPLAIARCTGRKDVLAAVDLAREHDVPLSVRSTGHSYGGMSVRDESLVLDLSDLNAVQVDSSSKRAKVGPGVRWDLFDRESQAFGLATTGATVSTVGVAGYTLGGGTGYLARKHGLALDNLLSAELVTMEGEFLRASEQDNPELFWGLRGGGAHLGVVTSLEFTLHEIGPQILAGQIVHHLHDAPDVLRFWRDFMADAPDDLQCYAFLIHIPPLDIFPPETHGNVALDLVFAYAGPIAAGERVVAPLRGFGDPILEFAAAQPYTEVQQAFDAGVPPRLRWYSRGHFFDAISDELIDVIVQHCGALPGPFTMVYLEPLGGAISEIAAAATAYPHREVSYSFHILPGWSEADDDEAIMEWARAFSAAVTPFASGGVYVNFLSDDERTRVPYAFGGNFERLSRLRQQYDPQNLLPFL